MEISNLYRFNVNPYKNETGLDLDKFLYVFILNPYKCQIRINFVM